MTSGSLFAWSFKKWFRLSILTATQNIFSPFHFHMTSLHRTPKLPFTVSFGDGNSKIMKSFAAVKQWLTLTEYEFLMTHFLPWALSSCKSGPPPLPSVYCSTHEILFELWPRFLFKSTPSIKPCIRLYFISKYLVRYYLKPLFKVNSGYSCLNYINYFIIIYNYK